MASRVFDLIGQEELRQATTVEHIAADEIFAGDELHRGSLAQFLLTNQVKYAGRHRPLPFPIVVM